MDRLPAEMASPSRKPPRPREDAEGYVRASPEPPQAPPSARGSSPSPLQRRLRPQSSGVSGTDSSRAPSAGSHGTSRPGSAEEALLQGYIPMSEYVGIMALNKELFEQNKLLHAELVNIKVAQEQLLAEERFLRSKMRAAGLEPPPEEAVSLEVTPTTMTMTMTMMMKKKKKMMMMKNIMMKNTMRACVAGRA
ncbi:unnamed protein product [Effrenium voratum]|uniref:Uncharacterized protein n=1 Tax=Effrenium voratum TaxID=2562239 RepID=A0AA36MZN3_9DINO|nr:unnamed protein product [Effrenium voratum]